VTDVPHDDIDWFAAHAGTSQGEARELARAEHTARRDGYVTEWEQHWTCQLLEPDGETLVEWIDGVLLTTGNPDTDPRARVIAAQLALDAGV